MLWFFSVYFSLTDALWLAVAIIGMNFIGPILYFLLGKEDA